jgi:proliferating cell nuclear antigen
MGIVTTPIHSRHSIVEFRTNQIRPFKALFDSIKNKLPDTSLIFTPKGMRITQMDNIMSFLVDVDLDGEEFEHYYCRPDISNGEQVVEINLSALHLNQVFKAVTKDDTIFTFTYQKNNNDTVQITFSNEQKDETREYEIRIQTADDELRMGELDDVDYQYVLTMPSADLVRICRDLKTLECEQVQIRHDGRTLQFTTNGSIKATISREGTKLANEGVKFLTGDADSGSHSNAEHGVYCRSFKFSTLHDFSKCHSGSDSRIVKILLNDIHLVLQYEIGSLGKMSIAIAAIQNPEND